MENKPLYIAFFWHMHQPYYKNDLTGKYSLPWVRLHCIKDYYDMLTILDDYPQIKQTFNLVPSLLLQIEDYVKNNAMDEFLEKTIKSATSLDEEDKIFILHNFFMANWNTMVYAFPRYAELLDKRGHYTSVSELKRVQKYFTSQEFLDLQVLFNLSWIDPVLREKDPTLKELMLKGKKYTEEDKGIVIQKHKEIMAKVIPKYKEMQDKGQIEITTTPFYHPILPLLCDTEIAKIATPQINLPPKPFQHPEDAEKQVEKAIQYYQQCFGRNPKGMWPAEGSVSEDIIPIIASRGIQWIATDEDILAQSLKIVIRRDFSESEPYIDALYKPYKIKSLDKEINIIFRDRNLSDLIGFTYSYMSTKEAVRHFMKNLRLIRDSVNKMSGEHLLSIILDGENAWEFYPNDGHDFLSAIYREISNDPTFKTVTVSQYLESHPPTAILGNLFPGSWINHNFGVWIGHPEDNLAWEYLNRTREDLLKYIKTATDEPSSIEIINKAWEEIFIAEGSDWCWWYGDDHSSANDEEFDGLFRNHLINVYKLIAEKIPDWLYVAIKGLAIAKPTQLPRDLIRPVLDGKITNYFEWQDAGFYDVSKTGGTMYQSNSLVKSIYYGFDLHNMYLRIDTNPLLNTPEVEDISLHLHILEPKSLHIRFLLSNKVKPSLELFEIKDSNTENKLKEVGDITFGNFIELSIPFADIFANYNDLLKFVLVVKRNNFEIERWPNRGVISFNVPGEDFILNYWYV